MKKTGQFLLAGTMLILLFACQKKIVYEQYQPVPERSWNKDSLMVFTVPVTDTVQYFNLFVNVRNDVNYKYSNLWLFVSIEQPGGKAVEDKFEITLADPSGRWLGEGFGGLKTRESLYRNRFFFPSSGEYKISIRQGMREDVLNGICDVGIRIEKTE